MDSINLFGLQMAVRELYRINYQNILETEKRYYGENTLSPESSFVFAQEMAFCFMSKNPKREIDSYIQEMLDKFCKENVQAYYEMLLSVSLVASVFYDSEKLDLSKHFAQWFATLAYDENFYSKYVTDENIERFWTLR